MSDHKRTAADLRWYVVNTFGDAEWEAFQAIQRPKFDGSKRCEEVFFPFYLRSWRKHRYHHGVTAPHFPGYIFAAFGPLQSAIDIKGLSGVKDVLRNGTDYVLMPRPVIEKIKAKAVEYHDRPFDVDRPKARGLQIGDIVAIPEGAFKGVPAVVENVDKRGRVEVAAGLLRFSFPAAAFDCAAASAKLAS